MVFPKGLTLFITSAQHAEDVIQEKRYALALKDYTGQKLAIIAYDSKLKKHSVKIEDIWLRLKSIYFINYDFNIYFSKRLSLIVDSYNSLLQQEQHEQ